MSLQKCAGCFNTLKGVAFLQCSRCYDKYHYTCLNFNKQDYNGFSKEFKESWVCPSCKCKEPKAGDNTNTPVRTTTAALAQKLSSAGAPTLPAAVPDAGDASASEYNNVTLRSRPRSSCNCTCITAEGIREILREELDRKLNSQLDVIQSQLTSFKECLAANRSQNEILSQENESQRAVITELQKENEILRTTTNDVSRRLHQLEHLSRSNNLEVQCVPENKSENILNTIQQLGKIIKCPVADPDIQYCSRIAKLNSQSSRPRSILVKFCSRRLRDDFLASVIKYNRNNPNEKLNSSHLGIGGSKKTPVYVGEHLTLETKSLHAAARRAAHQFNYKFVWVRDGKVFLRKSETSGYVHVRSQDILKSLA